MKNFTTLLLLITIFSAFAGNVHAAPAAYATNVFAIQNTDLRAKALENVFERNNSPLVPFASTYISIADKYGIDWRLLPAIAGLESSFGKRQMPNSHNSYGWGGGYIYFDSYEQGIEIVIASLKKRYYDRGADTVYKIAPIYAESPTWAPRVTIFMNQIEAEYARLETHSLELTI